MLKTVCFNVDIDDKFEEEFKAIISHHIDQLIDQDSFPEIKDIYSADVIDGNSFYSATDNIFFERKKRGMMEDLRAHYKDAPESCKQKAVEYLVDNNNYDYSESYWDNIDCAIRNEIENGPEEITSDKVSEFLPVMKNYSYKTDRTYSLQEITETKEDLGALYDIVSFEINPEGIPKLERYLERKNPTGEYSEKDIRKLNDPEDDAYERIVMYLYFTYHPDAKPRISLAKWTPHDIVTVSPELILTTKEKKTLIDLALDYIKKA